MQELLISQKEEDYMKYNPEYAENIIVGVIYKTKFSWYITERNFWILDYEKRMNDFLENGFGHLIFDGFVNSRLNIPIVNNKTVDNFLEKIAEHKTETQELKDFVYHRIVEDTVLELVPSLFVDFDHKILYSNYPELLPFERYVPEGWIGESKEFTDYIPKEDIYWIFDSLNYIEEIYKEELEEFEKL